MSKIIVLNLVLISIVIGAITGLAIGAFLIILEKVIELNLEISWLIFLLPFSGVLMTLLYKKYGKNSKKGNNLIILYAMF